MGLGAVVEAEDLTKKFGKLVAVDGISFRIFKGECYGFLGPNGAGKTTTMKMIYCVSPPTSGKLTVLGMDVTKREREVKRVTGVAPQETNLDPDFTVLQNLMVYARYFDVSSAEAKRRAEDLLKFMRLEDKRDVIIEQLSGGMKRRLILARALINNPQVLILDEPTTGLDPQARHLMWDKIRSLQKQGVTQVLTTQYMDEAEQLCSRVAIMDGGKIIEEGRPTELIKKHVGARVIEIPYDEKTLQRLKQSFPSARFDVLGEKIRVFADQSDRVFEELLKDAALKEVMVREANLEDVFLKLTRRKLGE